MVKFFCVEIKTTSPPPLPLHGHSYAYDPVGNHLQFMLIIKKKILIFLILMAIMW